MLRGGTVNEIHELHRQRVKIREISRRLGVARNTVRKYLRTPGVPRARSRPGHPVPWVFHRSGKPIKDYYDAWRRACLKAGLAQKLPSARIKTERILHDFRRSSARNLIRAGITRPSRASSPATGRSRS
jgi:hypothetical protein